MNEQRSTFAACCVLLCERPPSLAATRGWHSRADRFLIGSRPLIVPVFVLLGFLASFAGSRIPERWSVLPLAVYFLTVGGWCSLNFARCREAHCAITGAGLTALAGAAFVAVGLGRDWRDPLWLAALGVLVAGFLFETIWTAAHGHNAVRQDDRPGEPIET